MADTLVSRMQDAVALERPVVDEAVALLRAVATGRPRRKGAGEYPHHGPAKLRVVTTAVD